MSHGGGGGGEGRRGDAHADAGHGRRRGGGAAYGGGEAHGVEAWGGIEEGARRTGDSPALRRWSRGARGGAGGGGQEARAEGLAAVVEKIDEVLDRRKKKGVVVIYQSLRYRVETSPGT
jgi:hypothetical protein